MTTDILFEKELPNGMRCSITDQSRVVAADRWLVRIVIDFTSAVSEDLWKKADDLPEKEALRKLIGDRLSFQQVRDRHFIDDAEKATVINDILQQITTDILPYAENDKFVDALFNKRVEEARRQIEIQQILSEPSDDEDDNERLTSKH